MNEHEFELTEEGKREVQYFITECKAKRKEVLDNAGDTIKHTSILRSKKNFMQIDKVQRPISSRMVKLFNILSSVDFAALASLH